MKDNLTPQAQHVVDTFLASAAPGKAAGALISMLRHDSTPLSFDNLQALQHLIELSEKNNAVVRRDNLGTYTILQFEGREMVMCQHCRNHRPLDSFAEEGNDSVNEWQLTCVSNPRNKYNVAR